ncbi:hypothetical protein KKG83_05420 [Candidatus Micrarchaeota archaeon]|nr:hypothetical protein [Candidatus Micrarchaeota archaeon]MBU2476883.1 hypothetical protein [Candidatus Micrarchaeota archaeon]
MDKDSRFFLKKDFKKYSGKWVAVKNQKIISSDSSIKKALSEAKRKAGNTRFIFAKIPEKNQVLIL